jgi:hypothetical protein
VALAAPAGLDKYERCAQTGHTCDRLRFHVVVFDATEVEAGARLAAADIAAAEGELVACAFRSSAA